MRLKREELNMKNKLSSKDSKDNKELKRLDSEKKS